MRPDVTIKIMTTKLCPQTENIYNTLFWNNVDVVMTALDNLQARLYVDEKCKVYEIPMIDSGTLGTKASVQVSIPYQTASYGSTVDEVDEQIPVCIIKMFPTLPQHTIQWARELFEELFCNDKNNNNNNNNELLMNSYF